MFLNILLYAVNLNYGNLIQQLKRLNWDDLMQVVKEIITMILVIIHS